MSENTDDALKVNYLSLFLKHLNTKILTVVPNRTNSAKKSLKSTRGYQHYLPSCYFHWLGTQEVQVLVL